MTMRRDWQGGLAAALVLASALTAAAAPVAEQEDRRGRTQPGLVVETGARTATCDVLLFTADGDRILAAGDDKVVRSWHFTPQGLDPTSVQTLRWPTWRDQRGSIYALALSRDERHVAVGGYGVRTGAVAVLDRRTGEVEGVLTDTKGNTKPIRAAAFSPTGETVVFGNEDGGIWRWRWRSGRDNDCDRLDRHAPSAEQNFVRLLAFTDNTHLLSVTEQGQVEVWDVTQTNGRPDSDLNLFLGQRLRTVQRSSDGGWLVAGTEGSPGHNWVLLRALQGGAAHDIPLEKGDYPRSLAFDARGQRLAVAVGHRTDSDFFIEEDDRIVVYDLTGKEPVESGRLGPTYHADALAFHPNQNFLAVAGGANHEVTLWDLATARVAGEPIRSPGSCLWGVGLGDKDHFLGFREQRNPQPAGPDDYAAGPWRVFDLERRKFVSAEGFRPAPSPAADGWKVVADPKNQYRWSVQDPGGKTWPLPLNLFDAVPRCFAFLPGRGGKPTRLVVGHYWGASVFELAKGQPPRRVRWLIGHQSEVMALAPSADQTWLVTASRDQTIAAWNLEDWKYHPALGADFVVVNDQGKTKVVVAHIDPGSPAWEAGLKENDEVVLLHVNIRDFLYDPEHLQEDNGVRFGEVGDAERCVQKLAAAEPAQELDFRVRRGQQLIGTLTTLKERPLWRFFPTRDGQWVLWMHQNFFYDTSTNGDSFIGWQVNPDLRNSYERPTFYKAEQFRKKLQRPGIIDDLLGEHRVGPVLERAKEANPLSLGNIEPPQVSVAAAPGRVAAGDVTVTLAVTPHGESPEQNLDRVELWVNDFRLETWQDPSPGKFEAVRVAGSRLHPGSNVVTVQAYNKAGIRADGKAEVVYDPPQPPAKPRLHALLVAVGNYSGATPLADGKPPKNLPSVKDAEAMEKALVRQRHNGLYGNAGKIITLLDQDVSRQAVLGALRRLKDEVAADDRLVVFLSGHGDLISPGPSGGTFVFCGPQYDRDRPKQTGITAPELYEGLAPIPCRKVLLLDACHAGDAAVNTSQVRSLTPGNLGVVALCACDGRQEAAATERLGSLFTHALVEALDAQRDFRKASGGRHTLDTAELFGYVRTRLPKLLREVGADDQTPVCFPTPPEPLLLAAD